jgi:general stress protein 26
LAGHFGTYWEPPEPDEVLVHTVTGSDGVKVCLTDEQDEEYYDIIREAVGAAHSVYLDSVWSEAAEAYLASQDTEIPY